MDLQTAINLIKKFEPGHAAFTSRASIAERYYNDLPDILYKEKKKEEDLRTADNRIPRGFFPLLVDQKAAYLYTAPPAFDTGDKILNETVAGVLGEEFEKECKKLCVDASIAGVSWVHYWNGEHGLEYAAIDPAEVIPVWSRGLKKQLLAVLREYADLDEATGETVIVYEIWTAEECASYYRKAGESVDLLREWRQFSIVQSYGLDLLTEPTHILRHGLGEVPFIAFYNNARGRGDLDRIKKLIDVYDAVFSGFVDDLEDIQELILILTGYGGTDLKGFLNDLKQFKVIKLDADEGSGLDTLKMEIPVEARQTLLDLTRKAIFEIGQGYDPQPERFGEQSGVALRFMYAPLEMKASQQETEFRLGFARLVKAICRAAGKEVPLVRQTWTRTAIRNDMETVQMIQQSVGIVSRETLLRAHPLVDDPAAELERLAKEAEEEEKRALAYGAAFPAQGGGDDE